MPSGQSGDASRAEALNNLSLAQVVGWNVEAAGALLWEQPSAGNWSVVDLNSTGAIGGCNSRWSLFEGHDINNSQWIVVTGTDLVGSTGLHAILLTPFPTGCIADLDSDGCVDFDDMLVVIGASGACPVGSFCNADLTGDCVVDINDILAVNAVYCADPCPDPVPACCQTCPQCDDGFAGGGSGPDGPLTTEELIAAILSAPISEEMQAYLIEQLLSL
jgi:hypothetical protein